MYVEVIYFAQHLKQHNFVSQLYSNNTYLKERNERQEGGKEGREGGRKEENSKNLTSKEETRSACGDIKITIVLIGFGI